MKRFIVGVLILGVLGAAAAAAGQEILRVKGRGKASPDTPPAQARVLAKRAAVLDGYRKLAEAAGFKSEAKEGSKESTEVQAYLKNFTITATNYLSDYEAEVDIEMPVAAVIANVADYKNTAAEPSFVQEMLARLGEMEAALARLQDEVKQLKDLLNKRGGIQK